MKDNMPDAIYNFISHVAYAHLCKAEEITGIHFLEKRVGASHEVCLFTKEESWTIPIFSSDKNANINFPGSLTRV